MQQANRRAQITNDERSLIRDNVIMLMMLEMIDHNRKQIENSTNLLRPIFLSAADRLLDLVLADLKTVRQQLRTAQVKWWDANHTDFILAYTYVCRGFEGVFSITRDVAKTQLSIKFGEYFARVTEPFRAHSTSTAHINKQRAAYCE